MAGRPAKSATVIKLEGNTNRRTKKELAFREAGEKKLLAGQGMIEGAEIRSDKIAHREFLHIKRLLKSIEKDDEIYGNAVRRYCMNKSKIAKIDTEIENLRNIINGMYLTMPTDNEAAVEWMKMITAKEKMILSMERMAKTYRNEMIDFEKQHCMTIRSALSAIPKKPETKTNSLKEALGG